MHNNEWLSIWAVFGCSRLPTNELHIIVETNDLASSIRFDVTLGDLARFVIEKAMRISAPCDTSHVDPKECE